ncbi:M48 family metalloprotease [Oscillatoria sp. CS-180]|uniref:M48 family metalloprotease n=1 Tax=Oscillatoria sp. CS-180 TaxID=3021720 RepID=UPI00232D9F00|nr:M48 family metalloprotease [Oscillatoria sp. CS-180]MDB9525721.1 M48 family metalloprotease [Oscillatoria sp. CS-180]
MSHLPPSSSQATSAFEDSPNDGLQKGLMALREQNYPTAIRTLSKLLQNRAATGATRLKAHIGLVKALRGDGRLKDAIALCRKLVNHPQAKVQQWAKQTLTAMEQSALPQTLSTSSETGDLSGFQPLTTEAAAAPLVVPASQTNLPQTPAQTNPSGFQPLEDSNEDKPLSVHNNSTNDPNSSASAADEAVDPQTRLPNSDLTNSDDAESIEAASEPEAVEGANYPSADTATNALASETSLFHYERLNHALPSDTNVGNVDSTDADNAAPPITSQAPTASEDTSHNPEPNVSEPLEFAASERLSRLRSLPKQAGAVVQIWLVQGVSAIALFWLCHALTQIVLAQVAKLLRPLTRFVSIPLGWRYEDHTVLVLAGLSSLLLASPWILDCLLKQTAQLKPLSIQSLKQKTPEGCRLLNRVSRERGWLLPSLHELPTDAPLIFSYGWLPRYNRIVISRGVLERLDDDELATLIGYELTHFTTGTLPFMSLISMMLQLLYQGYWQSARLGDRKTLDRASTTLTAFISALCYGLYWLVRKVTVPCSRARVLWCDRRAVEWTGNPNALMRALVKLESGIAETISNAGYTPPLVESTDLMTPCGIEATLSLGSLFPHTAFLQALQWDIQNPYRHWLSINSSHPLLGERLKRLTGYALRWQLTPALPVAVMPSLGASSSKLASQSAPRITFWSRWLPFLQQVSPYIGPLVGVVMAMLLWFFGGLFEPLGLRRVAWIYGDRSVLWGSLLLGLGMGIMFRINPYFPDITTVNRLKHPPLPDLLQNPLSLPTDSQPLRLEGRLLGRKGMANWLCQDLILETSSGLLKLHFLSILGAVGNLLIHPQHPTNWVGHRIAVQGWYRRGAISWIDIEALLKSGKVVARANHPLLAVLLSLTFCAWGLIILIRG